MNPRTMNSVKIVLTIVAATPERLRATIAKFDMISGSSTEKTIAAIKIPIIFLDILPDAFAIF